MGSGIRWGQRWVEDEGWGEVRHRSADELYVTRSYTFTILTHLREGHPFIILSKVLAYSLRIHLYFKQSAKFTMGILFYIHE